MQPSKENPPMFNSIKTSRENKERVINLTRKLNLGAENVIARIAFAYSLSMDRKLSLDDLSDAQGKEYSRKVLFGEYASFYIAMLCTHYNLHKSDRDIPKLVKLHIDDGLETLSKEVENMGGSSGTDFLIQKIESGLS